MDFYAESLLHIVAYGITKPDDIHTSGSTLVDKH